MRDRYITTYDSAKEIGAQVNWVPPRCLDIYQHPVTLHNNHEAKRDRSVG